MKQNKIKLIAPFYNAAGFIDKCMNSVLTQSYDNFDALFIDDGSTDESFEVMKSQLLEVVLEREFIGYNGVVIKEYICKHKRKTKAGVIKIWKRDTRSSALPNWTDSIMRDCEPTDIVVSLDGDDWLAGGGVLTYVNEQFQDENLWFMYGGCSWTDGRKCCSLPYNEEDFKNIRKAHFKVSQMRTFYAGLFHNIEKIDPEFTHFKNSKGEFYEMACDVALAYPLLEMAGLDRIKHNTKPVYIYNRENPINDDKVNQQLQWAVHAEILNKKPFNKLEKI